MKILVLTSTFPRWVGDNEPRFVEKLSEQLARHGHDVHILAPHFEGAKREERFGALSVHRFRYAPSSLERLAYEGGILSNLKARPWKHVLIPLFLLGQLFSVIRLMRHHRFDVIHAHWIFPQGWIGAIAARLFSCRLVLTSHGGDLFALNGYLFRHLKRWTLSQADAVTVVSNAMKQRCRDEGLSAKRIDVMSMGVELTRQFIPGTATRGNNILFVGRLVEKKGCQFLLEAMSRLREKFPLLRLDVVGDGPERGHLENYVRSEGLTENVRFHGAQSQEAVIRHFQQAALTVMPSIVAASGDQEGLGLVAVEALGCGSPLITSDLPALRDAVTHNDTALMVAPGQSSALASAIEWMLTHETERREMAARGRDDVLRRFDWSSIGESYHRLLRAVDQEPRSQI